MSRIRANTIVNGAGTGAPNFPRGAIISGISTINAEISVGTGTSISSPATNTLALGTNDVERLRITSDGDLILKTSGTMPVGKFVFREGSDDAFSFRTTGANGAFEIYDEWDDQTRLHITSAGLVGINETSPSAILDVKGTISAGAGTDEDLQQWNIGSNNVKAEIKYVDAAANRGMLFGTTTDHILAFQTNNAERLRIDSSGRVTTPYQLWIAGSPTNTGGTGIFNSFNTSLFASPVGLSFSTDRITVPIAGVYMITFNTICDNSSVRKDTLIMANGSTISSQLSEDSTAGYHYRSASLAVKLSASDYIQFSNEDWYDSSAASTTWRTASVYLLG